MKRQNCYMYTRVSTSMQVDGYSLDAQKVKLHKYADFQNMFIAGEYSDEGKSGKNIGGRPEFQQMLADIESVRTILIMCLYSSSPVLAEMRLMSSAHYNKCRISV